MSNVKAVLKAAKSAIDSKQWDEAIAHSEQVLSNDPSNYFALLFLGRARQQQRLLDQSEEAYKAATAIKVDDPQAWLGLRDLYEAQADRKVNEYTTVGLKLAEIFGKVDDKHRGQIAINKIVDFARKHGTRVQYFEALQTQLPTSSVYSYLEGRLPYPTQTYLKLAEITEQEEEQRISKAISERRTRLGARLTKVTAEVKLEVYSGSSLEDIYQAVVDWTNDDEIRRTYEEKRFQRAYDMLAVLPSADKEAKLQQVLKLAEGMVIIKHAYLLAWQIALEWRDAQDLEDLDADIIHQFVHLFPDQGLSKVLKAFLASDISPWPASPASERDEDADGDDNSPLNAEDRLVLMTEGIDAAKDSYLAHRLMSEYYAHLGEHELATETARKGLKLLAAASATSGMRLQANVDALNSILATSLIYYQTPRNNPEAKSIFERILQRKKTFTPALIGIGLILEEEEDYAAAIDFLKRALDRDPTNFRIGAEAAWCKAMAGDFATGLDELQRYLQGMMATDSKDREMKGQTFYRIGKCRWELNVSKSARKDRKSGPYLDFLAAIKTDPNCAPAYTALGIFYQDYANDKKRARQCYQKAFELSPSEVIAAERMARSFADSGDWEIVEIISQRVIDTGQAKPAPGSRKKGISWPFSAVGVVQMNRQDYSQAIVSFLAALRISPDDYHSYIGLGESYHNSGRYNSAARAFNYANSPPEDTNLKDSGETWFTKYMLANVHRELGDFEEAINGYEEVLSLRQNEFGVSIALLQTLVERAARSVESGFFGLASDCIQEAIRVARPIVHDKPNAFNLWKAVGDACAIFSWIQRHAAQFPIQEIKALMQVDEEDKYDTLCKIDGIDAATIRDLDKPADEDSDPTLAPVRAVLTAAILAHKRAVQSCSHDIHARAVSWYNLGWTEYRAHVCLEATAPGGSKDKIRFLQASMRCFKRAIELEAGNAEFWDALGVVTTGRSPKVAQHAFVRSLHLNERSPKTWTNLGTLYLLQNDYELAHQAYVRAQSTDPDYAAAWLGEGILALLWGNGKEAKLHFTHAFEISGADSAIAKRLYATSAFDKLASSAKKPDAEDLIRPLFAMTQLHAQEITTNGIPYQQLLSLLHERTAHYEEATGTLVTLAERAEQDYEQTESDVSLFHFASVKADLARDMLASKEYANAAEAAETALDLTAEDVSGIAAEARRRVRLSAHLTTGLSEYYQNNMDSAFKAFRDALTESNSNPDVVCLLAQVLWFQGGEKERGVAREQLFETVEKNTGHVGAVCLLGAMGVLDGDVDVCEAIKEELQILRTADDISEKQREDVETVLEAVIACLAMESEASILHERVAVSAEELNEVQTSIMLNPAHPHPWNQLNDLAPDDPVAAQMALDTAMRTVPPRGGLAEGELAEVLARAGSISDVQRALVVAPWLSSGWEALGEAINGMI